MASTSHSNVHARGRGINERYDYALQPKSLGRQSAYPDQAIRMILISSFQKGGVEAVNSEGTNLHQTLLKMERAALMCVRCLRWANHYNGISGHTKTLVDEMSSDGGGQVGLDP